MKLMIDIDDELYNQALRDQCYHEVTGLNDINYYSLTIANGIPVSSEDDLINRSALKSAIAEFHQTQKDRLHNPLWDSISINNLNDLIDNAPTANIPQGKWHEGFHEGFNAGNTFHNTALESIGNGVVLPDGHGDLIDRNYFTDKYAGCGNVYCEALSCKDCNSKIVNKLDVDSAPTIIPAD